MSLLSARKLCSLLKRVMVIKNSQKYSRSRICLPSHLVLFAVLQDLDEVDCSALLHVRDLTENGQIIYTSQISPANVTGPPEHGHTKFVCLFRQEDFFCVESLDMCFLKLIFK